MLWVYRYLNFWSFTTKFFFDFSISCFSLSSPTVIKLASKNVNSSVECVYLLIHWILYVYQSFKITTPIPPLARSKFSSKYFSDHFFLENIHQKVHHHSKVFKYRLDIVYFMFLWKILAIFFKIHNLKLSHLVDWLVFDMHGINGFQKPITT